MAYTVIASVGTPGNQTTVTSTSIDTTGADLIVICFVTYVTTGFTVSDSKSNTWTLVKTQGDATYLVGQMYYSKPTSTGTGHTFTVTSTGGNVYISICALALSGSSSSPVDQIVGSADTNYSDAITNPGNITPTEDNEILVYGYYFDSVGTVSSITGGFTSAAHVLYNGGINFGTGLAYKIQTTAGVENPTLTLTSPPYFQNIIASFKAAAALAAGPTVNSRMLVGVGL